ncbi:nuclear transport factor 2 family protein [Streptomyces sp. NBC_00271]|uniref:nuclear transport factor 2 family protein n=1 Tax=Streptomyces sp. NBC_00271 TaxID=2975697 RepID=UPI002E2D235F|nr:nuclear transport factor 2 family protein [Streptomyces sp. NBC_00271]
MDKPLTDQPQDDLAVVRVVYDFVNGSTRTALPWQTRRSPSITARSCPGVVRTPASPGSRGSTKPYRAPFTARWRPRRLYQAGDRVVQTGRTRGIVRATGKPFDAREMHVWRVRNGRIMGLEVYVETPVLLEALKP